MCFLPHRVFLAAPPQWPPSARCSSVPWWPPTRPVPPADVDSLGFVPGKWWKNDGTCRDSCGFSRILASWGVIYIYIYRIWTSEYWEVHHQNSGRCQDSVGFELQNIWVEGTDNLIMRWSIPLAKHLEVNFDVFKNTVPAGYAGVGQVVWTLPNSPDLSSPNHCWLIYGGFPILKPQLPWKHEV